jgi:hypothetical protein
VPQIGLQLFANWALNDVPTLWVGGGFYLPQAGLLRGARKPSEARRIGWWDDEARAEANPADGAQIGAPRP